MLEISATILHPDGPDSSAHDSKATYWIVLEQYSKFLRGDINVFGSERSQLSVECNKNNVHKSSQGLKIMQIICLLLCSTLPDETWITKKSSTI